MVKPGLLISRTNKKRHPLTKNSMEQAKEHRNKNSQSQEFFDYDFIHCDFLFKKEEPYSSYKLLSFAGFKMKLICEVIKTGLEIRSSSLAQ